MIIPKGEAIRAADVADHYDRLDQFYREIWGEHLHHGLWSTGRETPEEATRQLMVFGTEALEIRSGDAICDVGCGYGAAASYLHRVHGALVTGLTNSPSQFEIAWSTAEPKDGPKFLLRNWEDNRLDSESFDGLLSIECLAHVPDKPAFFREIHRVLRPGGRAVVLDWFSGDRPCGWEIRHLLEPICRDGNLAGLGTLFEYDELIGQAGLELKRFDDLTANVQRTWSVLSRRIAGYGLTRPAAWRFLAEHPVSSWRYAMTIPRLRIAYARGALRYGCFVIGKP